MKNPFEYGGVVALKSFCNRKKELQDLQRVFTNGERMFLYAERRVGKTSLIKKALNNLDPSQFVSIYVDLWPTDSEADFAIKLAKAITESTSTASGNVLTFAKKFFGFLKPAVTLDENGHPKVIFGVSQNDERPPELSEVLEVIPKLSEQLKKQVVIVLDEFQQITEYESDAVEKKLRSAIQHHKNVSYLFSGSRKHILESMFVDQQRPLYRAAGHYPLQMIETSEWTPFITEKFTSSQKTIGTDVIEQLCRITRGHPFYTQNLCNAIWELTDSGKEATKATLDQAIDLLLQRENFAFTTLWESLANNQRSLLSALAVDSEDSKPFSAQFVQRSGLRTPSNVQRASQALIKRDLIDRDESGNLYIPDRFLEIWIRTRIENIN
ncbi:MAG TPA: ATP-binding protein [Planktothrix sp.]|jgi:hypothetical protein